MQEQRPVSRHRHRKCRCCKEFFHPDARNRRHHHYCSKPCCRQASKHSSQQRWLNSEKGKDYFSGADNVRRVQHWRKAHPGYWKRKSAAVPVALQDVLIPQIADDKQDTGEVVSAVLQDFKSVQPALIIGLIASLTGSALQDDIAETTRRFIVSGRDILGCMPGSDQKGGCRHDNNQTRSL